MLRNLPLAYFHGVARGQYLPCWPAYLVHDNPADLCFSVALDDPALARWGITLAETEESAARRSYVTALVRRRMHQQTFREWVLRTYREHCTVCRLRHTELLEAAHILPDRHERGEPIVSNGLCRCTLHHAAFDRHILGISPDLVVNIRDDILKEVDGPMLVHGRQGFQGNKILVPRSEFNKPNRDFLAERYDQFRKAS